MSLLGVSRVSLRMCADPDEARFAALAGCGRVGRLLLWSSITGDRNWHCQLARGRFAKTQVTVASRSIGNQQTTVRHA